VDCNREYTPEMETMNDIEQVEVKTETPEQMTPELVEMLREFLRLAHHFNRRVDSLSKNSMKRLLQALAFHPLEDPKPFPHKEETELFEMGVRLRSLKFNMMLEYLKTGKPDLPINTKE